MDPAAPIRVMLVVVGVIVTIFALREAAVVIIPLVAAALLCMLVWPLHTRLIRVVPHWLSSAAITSGLVVLSLTAVIAVWSIANTTLVDIIGQLDNYKREYGEIREWLIERRVPVAWLPDPEGRDPLVEAARDAGQVLPGDTSEGAAPAPGQQPQGAGSRIDASPQVLEDVIDGPGPVDAMPPRSVVPEDGSLVPYSGPPQGGGSELAGAGGLQPADGEAAPAAGTTADAGAAEEEAAEDAPAEVPAQVIQTGVNWVTTSVVGLLALVSGIAIALFLSALLLLEADHWRTTMDKVFGTARRRKIDEALRRGGEDVRAFLLVQTVCGAIAATSTGLLAWFLGVPHPLTWVILSFTFSYVPNIGAFIAGTPPTLLALLELGLWQAGVFAVGVAIIEMTVANLLNPLLQGGRVPLSSFWVLAFIIFWGWMWGIVGIFLAIPLSAFLVRFAQTVLGRETVDAVLDGRSRSAPGESSP